MRNTNVYFLLVFTFLILQSCGDKMRDRCVEIWNFQVPLDIVPVNNTFAIGDTLRVTMTTDNTALFDTIHEEYYAFPILILF